MTVYNQENNFKNFNVDMYHETTVVSANNGKSEKQSLHGSVYL